MREREKSGAKEDPAQEQEPSADFRDEPGYGSHDEQGAAADSQGMPPGFAHPFPESTRDGEEEPETNPEQKDRAGDSSERRLGEQ